VSVPWSLLVQLVWHDLYLTSYSIPELAWLSFTTIWFQISNTNWNQATIMFPQTIYTILCLNYLTALAASATTLPHFFSIRESTDTFWMSSYNITTNIRVQTLLKSHTIALLIKPLLRMRCTEDTFTSMSEFIGSGISSE